MTVQLNCVDRPLSMFSRAGVSFMESGTEVREKNGKLISKRKTVRIVDLDHYQPVTNSRAPDKSAC